MKSIFRIGLLSFFTLLLVISCVPSSDEESSQSMSSVEVNTQSMSPEDLARAYIAARQAYNMEQARPLLAEDVQIIENGELMSLEDSASFLRYAEAVGLNWEIVSCDVKSEGNTSEVKCPIKMYSNVSKALDIDPVAGSDFVFIVSNNKIASTDLQLDLSYWGPNVFRRMRGYIQQNHPESIPEMFVNGEVVGVSDEGIRLWKELSREFINSLSAQ